MATDRPGIREADNAKGSSFHFPRVRVVLHFFPRSPWRYWKPKRITADYREPFHVYRWLVFNIAPRGWPK